MARLVEEQSNRGLSLNVTRRVYPYRDYVRPRPRNQFSITWKSVTYTASTSRVQRTMARLLDRKELPESKLILKGVSGQLESGQMMAIMGPSGAGKSILMEAIIGRKVKGRSGLVVANSQRPLKLSFVPQHDQLFTVLTVREAIGFAVKVFNSTLSLRKQTQFIFPEELANTLTEVTIPLGKGNHGIAVAHLLNHLGLEVCADSKISDCSGGQLKRLSIAQEVIGCPDILVLDEPTSGLDVSATDRVILLMRHLTRNKTNPMTVLMTIHQPSHKLFSLFDKIYALSSNGFCIFDGSPTLLENQFSGHGLICPLTQNPADFLLDVASGDYGLEPCQTLNSSQKANFLSIPRRLTGSRPLAEQIRTGRLPKLGHFLPILWRTFVVTVRDPWLFGLRFGSHVGIALLIGTLVGEGIGQKGGCPPHFTADFDPTELEVIQRHNKEEMDASFDNTGNLFLGFLVILFTAVMSTVLTFPSEMITLIKEKNNQWYSVGTYYLAKTVGDIPFQVFFATVYVSISYLMADQIRETWRFAYYLLIMALVSLAAQSQGVLLGAIFAGNEAAAVFLSPLTMMPMALFAGYFMKISSMPAFFVPITLISYVKFGFEATLGVIFGFERCGASGDTDLVAAKESLLDWMKDMLGAGKDGNTGIPESFATNLVKLIVGDFVGEDGRVRSSVLNFFEVRDEDVSFNVLKIVIFIVVIRFATYLIVRYKANATE